MGKTHVETWRYETGKSQHCRDEETERSFHKFRGVPSPFKKLTSVTGSAGRLTRSNVYVRTGNQYTSNNSVLGYERQR